MKRRRVRASAFHARAGARVTASKENAQTRQRQQYLKRRENSARCARVCTAAHGGAYGMSPRAHSASAPHGVARQRLHLIQRRRRENCWRRYPYVASALSSLTPRRATPHPLGDKKALIARHRGALFNSGGVRLGRGYQ